MIARGRRRVAAIALVAFGALAVTTAPAHAKDSLSGKIAAAQKAANAAVAKLHRAQTDLELAQRDIAKFKAQSAANQARLNTLQQRLKSFAVRQYELGGGNLRYGVGDDPNAVARGDYLVRSVALGSVDELDRYRVLRADEAQLQRALETRLRDRVAAVAQAKALRASINAQLVSLGKAMKAQKNGQRVLARGPWVCPVQGPHAFTNDWGNPRSGGRRHKGTDIMAPYGTPTVAPVAGSVVIHNRGLGGLAWWLHGVDGNTYYGAHLSRTGATGRVAQGQIIGYVGTSGNARGGPAHLHFEIHPGNGAAVNPYGTLRAYC